jgi:ornithine--oxo-acid transaminase
VVTATYEKAVRVTPQRPAASHHVIVLMNRLFSMDQGFPEWLDAQQGRQYELHERHLNPAFVKMIRTIGFDKNYVRGEGAWLFDAEGRRYLDLLTGWGVFALGRNHPRVRSILEQVLSRDMPNLVRMDCPLLAGLVAEKLTQHACEDSGLDLTRVFFCNSGTESVEAAIKFARCYTRKPKILFCDHAFHGLTVGALSLNGSSFFRERFGNLMPDTLQGSVQRSGRARTGPPWQRRGGFVVEPVQGKTCAVAADGYLAEAARFAAGPALCWWLTKCSAVWGAPANGSRISTGPRWNRISSAWPRRSPEAMCPWAR